MMLMSPTALTTTEPPTLLLLVLAKEVKPPAVVTNTPTPASSALVLVVVVKLTVPVAVSAVSTKICSPATTVMRASSPVHWTPFCALLVPPATTRPWISTSRPPSSKTWPPAALEYKLEEACTYKLVPFELAPLTFTPAALKPPIKLMLPGTVASPSQ